MLESALDRPSRWLEQADLLNWRRPMRSALRNHLLSATSVLRCLRCAFLGVNGVDFIVPEAEAAAMILARCRRSG